MTATATATATITATATATPTATPTAPPPGTVATPIFSPDGGAYFITQARPVTISTTTTGAHLRYTLDGSTPTSSHGVEISFTSGTVLVLPTPGGRTLQAIGFKPGMNDSEVHSAIYTYEGNGTAPELEPGRGTNGSIAGVASDALTYDDNGNLQTYQGWTYAYDSQNRLTKASKGGVWAIFHYDGKNRQIARNINGDIRFSVWDGWELLEEYDSNTQVVEAYLQGAHGVIKSLTSNIYYYQDKLGSTTHIADAAGHLLESYRYDLFGTPKVYNGTTEVLASQYGITDLYAGERWIGELALYDLRNRFMSPELGRFLQSDPIGFKGDASNLYRYCHNDPEDFGDPMGLDVEIAKYREDDVLNQWIHNVNPYGKVAGGFVYAAHGNQWPEHLGQVMDPRYNSTAMGNGPTISATNVAETIMNHPAFQTKSKIFLMVCSSGALGSSLARDVAAKTGRTVIAPDKMLFISAKGQYFSAAPRLSADGKHVLGPDVSPKGLGSLVQFSPNGTRQSIHSYTPPASGPTTYLDGCVPLSGTAGISHVPVQTTLPL